MKSYEVLKSTKQKKWKTGKDVHKIYKCNIAEETAMLEAMNEEIQTFEELFFSPPQRFIN